MKKAFNVILTIAVFSLLHIAPTSCASTGTANSVTNADLCYTKPYLLTLNPGSEMNICWLTKDSSQGSVEYGETSSLRQKANAVQHEIKGIKTSATANGYDPDPAKNPDLKVFQQIVTLKNLKPNTTYYYRTTTKTGGSNETTKVYHFKTAPSAGGDFTFALLSDLQQKAEILETVKQIGQNKPNFIIYGGDLQNTPWKAGEWFPVEGCFAVEEEKGKEWFTAMQQEDDGAELFQYAPIFITPGNHEVDDQRIFFDKEMAVRGNWSMSIYMQLFRPLYPAQEYQPNGTHWYSVNYGDLHIANISVFRWQAWDGFEQPGWIMFDDISRNSRQVQWLENDLSGSSAKYKWVNMHWHMLNRGEDGHFPLSKPVVNGNTVTYPEGDLAYTVLKPLYERYSVVGVNYGHSHVYERYLINGVNYIEAASIGNNYRGADDPLHPSGIEPIIERNDIRSFMILARDSSGIHAKGIAASGPTKSRAFDNFTIVAR